MPKTTNKSRNNHFACIVSKKLPILIWFFLNLSFISCDGHCRSFYVDNVKGSDTNTGNQESPFKGLDKALFFVSPGDEVIIVSNGADNPYKQPFHISVSGRFGNPITIRGEYSHDKPVVVGNDKDPLLTFKNAEHIWVKDLIFQDTEETAIFVIGSINIRLSELEVKNSEKNGLVVTGGGRAIIIENCLVSDIENSGIVMLGSEFPLTDTLIQNCRVWNVKTNDGITLHKNSAGFDVGSHHVIRNNKLSHCAEQGIDITSGTDITIEKNETFVNGVSGIVVGSNVSGVKIIGNNTHDESQYGIIIGKATKVLLMENLIKNIISKSALLFYDCNDVSIVKNTVEFSSQKLSGSMIDIENSGNIKFYDNNFKVPKLYDGSIVRHFSSRPGISIHWSRNKWHLPYLSSTYVYNELDGKIPFSDFILKYAPADQIDRLN